MILRRFMQHVTAQNWLAVGLDVLVVVFGVYIGIFLGEVASERATRGDVQDALEIVRVQLQEDLKAADRIIAYRQEKLKEPELLLTLLAQDDIDEELVGQKLNEAFARMFTFFPKSSGYSSMKDNGYLARLDDPELLEALANLFDQVYVRHVLIADESDQNTFFYVRNVIAMYWKTGESGFIGDKAIARARIRNSIVQLAGYSDWYVQFLSESVRPAIADAITAIEAYQNQAR
jgi:hypothetical protein